MAIISQQIYLVMTALIKRGPNLFSKYFYFLFVPGLFYPLRLFTELRFLAVYGQWSLYGGIISCEKETQIFEKIGASLKLIEGTGLGVEKLYFLFCF